MALLALMIFMFFDQLCSLFNKHCKVIEKLVFVLLIICFDWQNRRQEEIVAFLCTLLNLTLIHVLNFKRVK